MKGCYLLFVTIWLLSFDFFDVLQEQNDDIEGHDFLAKFDANFINGR